MQVGGLSSNSSANNLGTISVPNVPSFSVNDFSSNGNQQLHQPAPQQQPSIQLQPSPLPHSPQPGPQPQVQLLPQSNSGSLASPIHLQQGQLPTQQVTVPGTMTIQVPAAPQQPQPSNLARPRKNVPEIVLDGPGASAGETGNQEEPIVVGSSSSSPPRDPLSRSLPSETVLDQSSTSTSRFQTPPMPSLSTAVPVEDRRTKSSLDSPNVTVPLPEIEPTESIPSSVPQVDDSADDPFLESASEASEPSTPASVIHLPLEEPTSSSESDADSRSGFGPPSNSSSVTTNEFENHEQEITTAIFRPDDAGAWKEQLRMAYEDSQRDRNGTESSSSSTSSNDSLTGDHLLSGGIQPFLSGRELLEDGTSEEAAADANSTSPTWKVKKTLKGSVAVLAHGRSLTNIWDYSIAISTGFAHFPFIPAN